MVQSEHNMQQVFDIIDKYLMRFWSGCCIQFLSKIYHHYGYRELFHPGNVSHAKRYERLGSSYREPISNEYLAISVVYSWSDCFNRSNTHTLYGQRFSLYFVREIIIIMIPASIIWLFLHNIWSLFYILKMSNFVVYYIDQIFFHSNNLWGSLLRTWCIIHATNVSMFRPFCFRNVFITVLSGSVNAKRALGTLLFLFEPIIVRILLRKPKIRKKPV